MSRALILSVASAIAAAAPSAETPSENIEHGLIAAANDFRAGSGLGRLSENPALTSEANAFAAYMARTDRFSHTADGRDSGERARAAGYDYCDLAENIAVEEGYSPERLAEQFMAGWEASPGHRRNLLNPRVTETGVGVARAPGANSRYFAVQVFGRPWTARFSFRIENQSDAVVRYLFEGESRQLPAHSIMVHTTCQAGDLTFDNAFGRGGRRFAEEPGATYLLSQTTNGVQIEIQRPARPRGRMNHD